MSKITEVYLVDCENMGCKHLTLLPNEFAIYFTSNNSNMICKGNEKEVHINHWKTHDAMDFIIDTYLGNMIAVFGKNLSYHIVSYDTGFDIVTSYWRGKGYRVVRNWRKRIYLTKREVVEWKVRVAKQFEITTDKERKELCMAYKLEERWSPSGIGQYVHRIFDWTSIDCKFLIHYIEYFGLEV